MNPFNVIEGDALERLRELPAESVQTIVTSPPYWGLRDYGIEGQIGLEENPRAFLVKLVAIFEAARRVLRGDGTLWVNMGDTYAAAGKGGIGRSSTINGEQQTAAARARTKLGSRLADAKPKDKHGIPWRLAFALQDSGWFFRSDVVWHKSNPMPESVRDRPTVAHEFVFLFSKSERYFYNFEHARERCVVGAAHARTSKAAARAFSRKRATKVEGKQGPLEEKRLENVRRAASSRMGREPGWRGKVKANASFNAALSELVEFRNWRDVWTIPSQPSSLEHFAAFPLELARRCVIAGSRAGDVVLDPFAGTGTTGIAAMNEGRKFIGIELNPTYAEMARERSRGVQNAFGFFGGPPR